MTNFIANALAGYGQQPPAYGADRETNFLPYGQPSQNPTNFLAQYVGRSNPMLQRLAQGPYWQPSQPSANGWQHPLFDSNPMLQRLARGPIPERNGADNNNWPLAARAGSPGAGGTAAGWASWENAQGAQTRDFDYDTTHPDWPHNKQLPSVTPWF